MKDLLDDVTIKGGDKDDGLPSVAQPSHLSCKLKPLEKREHLKVNLRDGKNNEMSDLIHYLGGNEFNSVRRGQIEECIR